MSHETIYQSLYVQGRGALRRELTACLRTGRALRRPPQAADRASGRGQIPGMVMISERPAEADDRAVPGHWEGDLIIGHGQPHPRSAPWSSAPPGSCMLLHLPDGHDADAVARRHARQRSAALPAAAAPLADLGPGQRDGRPRRSSAVATGIPVYFCDPHSPGSAARNENTNGLLRQYFPKGTSLARYTQADLDAVAPNSTAALDKPSAGTTPPRPSTSYCPTKTPLQRPTETAPYD